MGERKTWGGEKARTGMRREHGGSKVGVRQG